MEKWKEEAPEIPCDILADSIDDPLVRMFEALTTFDIGLDREYDEHSSIISSVSPYKTFNIGLDREYDEPLLRKAISDIEEAKSMSKRIREKAISADKRLEELFPKSLHDVLLHDLSHIKELMEGVLLEKVTGEEVAEAVFDVDKA